MKNILIIGGTGFLGKNIVEALVNDGSRIFLITRNKNFDVFKDSPTIKIIHGALEDINIIKNLIIEHKIQEIVHLASNLIPASDKSEFEHEMLNIVLPTFELLNFISNKNVKIIFFSSGGAIYGKGMKNKTIESCILEPHTFYGYSKLIIENHIRYLSNITQLRYVILRPSNVYGKYQNLNSNQGFIAVALGKILSNQPVDIWGDGNTLRDYICVRDVAQVVCNILRENIENEIFNIGSGVSSSLLEILDILEKNTKLTVCVNFKQKRKIDLEKVSLDINKLKSHVKFTPKTLHEGIHDFILFHEKTKKHDK